MICRGRMRGGGGRGGGRGSDRGYGPPARDRYDPYRRPPPYDDYYRYPPRDDRRGPPPERWLWHSILKIISSSFLIYVILWRGVWHWICFKYLLGRVQIVKLLMYFKCLIVQGPLHLLEGELRGYFHVTLFICFTVDLFHVLIFCTSQENMD